MSDVFHAYVIGGEKEEAQKEAGLLLESLSIAPENKVVSEHVTFSVDDARTLTLWQSMKSEGQAKAYICHTTFITREAQNALLKTFEEPVPGTYIFLCMPNPDMLLGTLLSRVRVVLSQSAKDSKDRALAFLKSKKAKRLAMVSDMLGKDPDDKDASALVRVRALGFMGELEVVLGAEPEKNSEILERILEFKKYLYIPGTSVRIILETVAVIL